MRLNIKTPNFCIRLVDNVGYLKVIGYQDKESSLFFCETIDKIIKEYKHPDIASLVDLQDLVLDDPQNARMINEAIKKLANHLNFKYNAIVIRPRFTDIFKAYIFSYYLKNANVESKIFYNIDKAADWLKKKNYKFEDTIISSNNHTS